LNADVVGAGVEVCLRVQFYLQAGGHLIADIAGWYTLS
jgi:hypothetical protein